MSAVGTAVLRIADAAGISLSNVELYEDGDDVLWVDDFVITNHGDVFSVAREHQIPGGADLDRVCPDIPCDATGAADRAAVALLRAWVNQSLDFAALSAVQPEE